MAANTNVITNIKIGKVNEDGVFEDPNDKGIYLLRCDMDVVVGDIIIFRKHLTITFI